MAGHLERIRQAELDAVRPWFRAGQRVLELGGGSGYQAAQIARLGCAVTSLDVPGRRPADEQFHPVQDYDGQHLPFTDEAFDLVFSSNVLEHIRTLDTTLAETRRVLAPGGMAIHLLPTPSWRFWTSFAHYPYLLKYLATGDKPVPGNVKAPSPTQVAAARGWRFMLRRALLAGAHGEYPSAASELYYFSERRWRRVFETAGFTVERIYPAGLFYTGYSLLPVLRARARAALARVLGSACKVYVLRRGT